MVTGVLLRASKFKDARAHLIIVMMKALPVLLALPLLAQDEPTIKVDVNLVNVLCSVRNKSNGLVGNLEKSDFKIFEDGKEMEIKYFTRETDLPLTMGL